MKVIKIKGCLAFIASLILSIIALVFILKCVFGQIGGKEPPITNQTYEVIYINGVKDIINLKAHEGNPYVESYRGSYYLRLRYHTKTIFGYKVNDSDGVVNGVLQFKRIK